MGLFYFHNQEPLKFKVEKRHTFLTYSFIYLFFSKQQSYSSCACVYHTTSLNFIYTKVKEAISVNLGVTLAFICLPGRHHTSLDLYYLKNRCLIVSFLAQLLEHFSVLMKKRKSTWHLLKLRVCHLNIMSCLLSDKFLLKTCYIFLPVHLS